MRHSYCLRLIDEKEKEANDIIDAINKIENTEK